jgi:hypothetical protein
MTQKTFSMVAGVIFSLIALGHLFRLVFKSSVLLGAWAVPFWINWVALILFAYLAYESFRLAKGNPSDRISGTVERIKTWSESAKNIAQIIAIVVAGLWTYQKFIKTEVPSLELRSSVTSDLSIDPLADKRSCSATFSVYAENIGQSSFDVSRVRVRGWEFDVAEDKKRFAVFVDTEKTTSKPPFFDQEFTSRRLVGRYAPGQKSFTTFEWILRRSPNKMIVFEAELHAQNPENARVPLVTSRWRKVCSPTD